MYPIFMATIGLPSLSSLAKLQVEVAISGMDRICPTKSHEKMLHPNRIDHRPNYQF